MNSRFAAVLALIVFGLAVPAASAGESERIRTKGGEVRFEADGDRLVASDTNPSHPYVVRAYLDWRGPRGGRHTAHVTSFSTDDSESSVSLSIREGTNVTLSMCYMAIDGDDGDLHVRRCSLGQDAEA
jgi:hypothetical protein